MREPMTLLEQSNRQRLFFNRTIRHPPVYIFSNNNNNTNDTKRNIHSFDDSSIKEMVATGKSMLPNSGHNQFIEVSLSPSEKDINHDETHGRRKRKRPSYRKSVFHSYSSSPSQFELAQITARGTKPEYQQIMSRIKNEQANNFHSHQAPPPTPTYDEIDRILRVSQDRELPRPAPQKPKIKKERPVPFRLPALNLTSLSHRTPLNLSVKEIQSNLSNYLQNYY